MSNLYSDNKNAQIVVALLKEHRIKKVIASPGTTNITIVGSMQHDSWFEMYSAVDERSAAYMACGLAAESNEPVVIVCTGATASRNYLPGLTEAYYRKLPIVVITGSHGEENIGHLHAQSINRTQAPKDTVKISVFIDRIKDKKDEWKNILNINKALLELHHHGTGPIHLNVEAPASFNFHTEELPIVRKIHRYCSCDQLPTLPQGKTAIFIGSHVQMSAEEIAAIDSFCEVNNSIVFGDHTSGYKGKYLINYALVASQIGYFSDLTAPDTLIHIGEVSGDTYTTGKLKPKSVWRVSTDGELRDLFMQLTAVFEIEERTFFEYYSSNKEQRESSYLQECQKEYKQFLARIPDLNFGNLWIAKELSVQMPKNSVIHFGIFNSLRSWNFFKLDNSIESSCNVGGFGIDGPTSTLLGAALAYPQKLHYLIVGDLAFFYDLNSLGNRHINPNMRILLINNGRGVEFRKKDHPGSSFGIDADFYIAAGGHFGNKSHSLVRHYAEDLGFDYMAASNKEEFNNVISPFLDIEITEKPMILEVFPEMNDEVNNIDAIRHIAQNNRSIIERVTDATKSEIKGFVKKILK